MILYLFHTLVLAHVVQEDERGGHRLYHCVACETDWKRRWPL